MRNVDIVVVGASAGGTGPLESLLGSLPELPDAAFFVAVHRSSPHKLVELFQACSRAPVELAQDAARIGFGRIYICPADHNLWLEHGRMRVESNPKDGFSRPSINVLFRSAANIYGRRVAGVLLSGLMQDGAAGLWHIKERGGVAIVQDPAEAEYPAMPQAAIDGVEVDHVLRADAIAPTLIEITKRAEPHGARRRVKVLVVEDEYLVARDISRQLQQRGYEVTANVSSGEDAIDIIATECPDIVMMDIRLAGALSGTETTRIIWQRFQIPVVYLTAFGDEKTLGEVTTSGGYGFVMKPLRVDAVEGSIELALHRRQLEMTTR